MDIKFIKPTGILSWKIITIWKSITSWKFLWNLKNEKIFWN